MDSSSQTGQMSSSNFPLPQRFCKCKEPEACILQASNSVNNPERRYYHCRNRGRRGDCKYWDWVDPVLSPYYKDCFLKLKLERDLALEELIRQRQTKEDKNTSIAVIEEEIALSAKDDEYKNLGCKIDSVEKRMKLLCMGILGVALLVLFRWV